MIDAVNIPNPWKLIGVAAQVLREQRLAILLRSPPFGFSQSGLA